MLRGFAAAICHAIMRAAQGKKNQRKLKMTVRAGREFLAIPGPTVIPDEVLRAPGPEAGPTG